MVYYFTSNISNPPATVYVGKDKFENEELIRFGWDCDIWACRPRLCFPKLPNENFHVDNLSSAHVYLRLSPEQKWDALPPALVEECAQLTKANSIEGNKKDNVTVIYTPWSNLLKNSSMATGQVSFHDPKKTKKVLVPTRINGSINRLEKTRKTGTPDELPAAKEIYLSQQRGEKRREAEKIKTEEERAIKERRKQREEEERGWNELMHGEGRSNEEGFDEDDFM